MLTFSNKNTGSLFPSPKGASLSMFVNVSLFRSSSYIFVSTLTDFIKLSSVIHSLQCHWKSAIISSSFSNFTVNQPAHVCPPNLSNLFQNFLSISITLKYSGPLNEATAICLS